MRRFGLFAFALFLSGCGGGGGASSSIPKAPAAVQYATILITVRVPAPVIGNGAALRPAYVSAATQSIGVAVDGGAATYTNLAPNTAACPGTTGYPLNCTISISASVGTHSLAFTTYDQQQSGNPQTPSGNVLAQNTINGVTFTSGATPNIPVVLQGIPNTVVVTFTGTNSFLQNGTLYFSRDASQRLQTTFSVVTFDAAGNLIIGPGAPSISVAFTRPPAGYFTETVSPVTGTQGAYTLSATNYQSVDDKPATLQITATPGDGTAGKSVSYNIFPSVNIKTFAGQYGVPGNAAGSAANATLPLTSGVNGLAGNGTAGPFVLETGGCNATVVSVAADVSYPSVPCSGSTIFAMGAAPDLSSTAIVYAENSGASGLCYLASYDPVALPNAESTITAPSTACFNGANATPAAGAQPVASASVDQTISGSIVDVNLMQPAAYYYLTFNQHDNRTYLRKYDAVTQTLTYVAQADYGVATSGALEPFGSGKASAALLQSTGATATDGQFVYVYSTGCIVSLDPSTLAQTVLAGQCGSNLNGDIDGVGTAAGLNGVSSMVVVNGTIWFTEHFFGNGASIESLRTLDLSTQHVTTLSRQVVIALGTRRIAHAAIPAHQMNAQNAFEYLNPGDGYGPVALWPAVDAMLYLPARNALLFPDTTTDTLREVAF